MANFDLSNLALKMACPTNELIADDKGIPGVYVQRSRQILSYLLSSCEDSSVHPAFLVNGVEISRLMIGKFQGKVHNNRVYSLPGEDPTASINLDTYEKYCKDKGDGHHCITAAEWAFLALLAKKNGTQPKGNNNYGKDISESTYMAIPSMARDSNNRIQRVATGTGPKTWSDNGEIDGIWDLNGNVWEWVSGIRLVKGELQVIPYNNAASPDCDTSATSSEWKAINAAATSWTDLFITPNGQGTTPNSIKLDYVSSHWQWATSITSQADSSRSAAFASTTFGNGVTDFCKMYLHAMALAPEDSDTDYGDDVFWANNGADERCALRGGRWHDGADNGVFALSFGSPRSNVRANIGGRPAFYE